MLVTVSAPFSTANRTNCSAVIGSGGAVLIGSRSACDVNQFWQYPQCRSQPSIPKLIASVPGKRVEERFLLDGIALQRAEVIVRNEQRAAAVESHPANPVVSVEDQAAMAARVTPHLVIRKLLVQLAFGRKPRQLIAERLHPRFPGRRLRLAFDQ